MLNITSSVLCPACGTKNHTSFNPGARCTSCSKILPTIIPRAFVYAARTLFLPILLLILTGVVLYASPQLKEYRDTLNHKNPPL